MRHGFAADNQIFFGSPNATVRCKAVSMASVLASSAHLHDNRGHVLNVQRRLTPSLPASSFSHYAWTFHNSIAGQTITND
jgi:hypothetical protein